MQEWTLATGTREVLLRVCEWPGDGPPVVVLHGFLEQGAAWDAVATRLGRRVIAPDQRGHGRSGHVGTGGFYHFWDYVSDLDALVAHLGGTVDLIGHSMGGTVAALFAACRPETIRRLVLVEGLGPADTTDDPVRHAVRFLDHRRRPSRHPVFADVTAARQRIQLYNPHLPDAVAQRLGARGSRPIAGARTWAWDARHRMRNPTPFSGSQFKCFLQRITAPTLLVSGGKSTFTLPDHAERAAQILDATAVVLPDSGHLLHHDAPAALAEAIRAHLVAA